MEPFDWDLLKEGSWSDAVWSMKRYAPQGYKFAVTRTPQQIKCDVLNSRRVQHLIEKVIFSEPLITLFLVRFVCKNRERDKGHIPNKQLYVHVPYLHTKTFLESLFSLTCT